MEFSRHCFTELNKVENYTLMSHKVYDTTLKHR